MAEVQKSPPLKYTVTHYRKEKHTHEEFMKWVVEEHLPLALPVYKRYGVISYSIFTTPAPLNNGVKEVVGKMRPTWDFADYDCCLEYIIPSMEVISRVMADPDWKVAVKDQDEWLDTEKALVSLGHFTPYLLETGEVVNVKAEKK